jgi:hypothetical protein
MRVKAICRTLTLLFPALLWAAPAQHIVSAKFEYDFKRHHGCKGKENRPCVVQFNIYDIPRQGQPVKLFSIPAPPGAKKRVKAIVGDSGPVELTSGRHTFGATAQLSDGHESDPRWCTVNAIVGPDKHVALDLP